VDWAFRLAEIDINSMIYEEPPLSVYGKTAGDLETRRAVELMDLVKNKRDPAVRVCPAGGKIRYLHPGDHQEVGDDRNSRDDRGHLHCTVCRNVSGLQSGPMPRLP
jgi:hypothetical protein